MSVLRHRRKAFAKHPIELSESDEVKLEQRAQEIAQNLQEFAALHARNVAFQRRVSEIAAETARKADQAERNLAKYFQEEPELLRADDTPDHPQKPAVGEHAIAPDREELQQIGEAAPDKGPLVLLADLIPSRHAADDLLAQHRDLWIRKRERRNGQADRQPRSALYCEVTYWSQMVVVVVMLVARLLGQLARWVGQIRSSLWGSTNAGAGG